MISVLDPHGTVKDQYSGSQFIKYLSDDLTVAPEASKNLPVIHESVDRYFRVGLAAADKSIPIFRNVFVETKTGCNCTCNFCPVNVHTDPRPKSELSDIVLRSIASQLQELKFSGAIHLFCNNEPLLDTALASKVQLFRQHCPAASIKVLTNGMKLSAEIVHELFKCGLSVLVINNYTDGRQLIRPLRDLLNRAHEFANNEIRVSMRLRNEVLTSRAGQAPNKLVPDAGFGGLCMLPYTDLVVSARGTVPQCCFDATNESVFGDVLEDRLIDIWRNHYFHQLRSMLLSEGRRLNSLCRKCDFDGFRDPGDGSLTRTGLMHLDVR